jgi:hypothetical protein
MLLLESMLMALVFHADVCTHAVAGVSSISLAFLYAAGVYMILSLSMLLLVPMLLQMFCYF